MAQAKSTDPVKVAQAMEGMKLKSTFGGDVEMRKTDHQLQQPLYMTVWQKADAKYPYSPENTGMTLAPVAEYPNYVSSTPTSCQMKRPGDLPAAPRPRPAGQPSAARRRLSRRICCIPTALRMEFFTISLLNGVSYGLLLFMLSSGLTLIFSMMGVLNFAHASFYMLGAYIAYSIARFVGFWPGLVVAPLVVGAARRAVREDSACAGCTSSATCPNC